jgi:hypothetical protein
MSLPRDPSSDTDGRLHALPDRLESVNAANIHLGAGRTDEARSLLEWAIEVRDHKGIVLGANRVQQQLAAVRN